MLIFSFIIPQENGILFELDTIARGSSACEFHNELIAVIENVLDGLCRFTDVASFSSIYDCPTCVFWLVVSAFSIDGLSRFLVSIGEVNE
jgi:hypothetical protein